MQNSGPDSLSPGDIMSHAEMCAFEGLSLQRGMNFHSRPNISVILMSRRRDAPYEDRILEGGRVLIYEGHDVPRRLGGPDPKAADQPGSTPEESRTQNGLFHAAAQKFKRDGAPAEIVRVYEKIQRGIWSFNGSFRLTDSWQEQIGSRKVFRFRLEILEDPQFNAQETLDLAHNRLIPTAVKVAVWRRDKGRCVKCGATDNLHFDHDLPFSKGGTSLDPRNIQLLCARHNLQKRDNIE